MRRICPLPQNWAKIHSALLEHAANNTCDPLEPPKPLILAGWNFSEDDDKSRRWAEMVQWAKKNECEVIVNQLGDCDWYEA